MALSAGTSDATTGLAKAIYNAMDDTLRPPLEQSLRDANTPEDQIASTVAKVQATWRPLSFAVALGVVSVLRKEPLLDPAPPDPVFAETFSSTDQDAFWTWLAGFVQVFTSWLPTTPDGTNLKNALVNYLAGKPVPTALKGIVR